MASLNKLIQLPPPILRGNTSVEEAIYKRRSVREYSEGSLTFTEISQLLWSAQGITNKEGYRTVPSAGALFPLEIYLVVGNVENLEKNVYKYYPTEHALSIWHQGDVRTNLGMAAIGQECIIKSSASIVITAVFERVTTKYGKRGVMYVHMEAGHAAQNVHLQAESLNIGTVVIGAFSDEEVKKVLLLPDGVQPLCIMPLGRKRLCKNSL